MQVSPRLLSKVSVSDFLEWAWWVYQATILALVLAKKASGNIGTKPCGQNRCGVNRTEIYNLEFYGSSKTNWRCNFFSGTNTLGGDTGASIGGRGGTGWARSAWMKRNSSRMCSDKTSKKRDRGRSGKIIYWKEHRSVSCYIKFSKTIPLMMKIY